MNEVELTTKSAFDSEGNLRLKLSKITVHVEKKQYRSNVSAFLGVEPDGQADFLFPVSQPFNVESIGGVIEKLLGNLTDTVVKVFNEHEKDLETTN